VTQGYSRREPRPGVSYPPYTVEQVAHSKGRIEDQKREPLEKIVVPLSCGKTRGPHDFFNLIVTKEHEESNVLKKEKCVGPDVDQEGIPL